MKGRTEAEVMDEMVSALEFHREGLAEDGEPQRRPAAA